MKKSLKKWLEFAIEVPKIKVHFPTELRLTIKIARKKLITTTEKFFNLYENRDRNLFFFRKVPLFLRALAPIK